MFPRLLHRMIFWELLKVFSLALLGISCVLLVTSLAEVACRHDITLSQVQTLAPILLCVMLPRTVPTALLFACCVVHGRLAHDGELLALKMSGIPTRWTLLPALFLGCLLSVLLMVLYLGPVPRMEHQLATTVVQELLDNPGGAVCSTLKRQGYLSFPSHGYTITVRGVQGQHLLAPTIRQVPGPEEQGMVVTAEQGTLEVNREQRKLQIHLIAAEMMLQSGMTFRMKSQTVALPLPTLLDVKIPRATHTLEWDKLLERRKALQENASHGAGEAADKRELALHQKWTAIEMQLQGRPAMSVVCLCFVLIGCPLGIRLGCASYLRAFFIAFLPVILLYYPLLYTGFRLGFQRELPPPLAVWGPNAVLLLIAALVLRWLR
jgi:lipopolysaccharide export system permease protein